MIGCATCECIIYNANSLKEKRAVLQRIITRLRQRFNISVAETDFQDLWQRTEITIAIVSSDKIAAEKELEKALQMIDSFPEIERTVTTIDWL
ncbi:DUF503 domain-containing protein [Calidifontibacillus erzurumensis]|uniref:DUF503 family protein n=1 Tax=Calidifontibacillus erzurumensis TaxID=2741433 RepID=A0A8J8K7V8_9BACI|nr:DUF503 family protein [Calidifontibacillus erzurumensis]NSL51141.1 DUF503 family protein [Calidifontibacillus erzurumensis]